MTLAETIRDGLVHEVNELMTAYNETKIKWEAITYCGREFRWARAGTLMRPGTEYAGRVSDAREFVTCLWCVSRSS